MNPLTYFRLVWKTNRSFVLFSMFSLAALQLLILNLVTTFDTQAIINSIFAQLPDNMKIFLSESFFSTLTFDGAAAFAYNHPMVIALISVVAINIPVRQISRELETGTMELLLSHPVKRENLIITLWISGVVVLLFVVLAAFSGSILAIHLFHNLTPANTLLVFYISVNMWLFGILVMSYTTLIASFTKGGNMSGNMGAMIAFVFYLVFLVSQLWDKIKFLQPYNIFYYYEPQKIMLGKGNFWIDVFVLSGLSVICFGLSIWFFKRRDIP